MHAAHSRSRSRPLDTYLHAAPGSCLWLPHFHPQVLRLLQSDSCDDSDAAGPSGAGASAACRANTTMLCWYTALAPATAAQPAFCMFINCLLSRPAFPLPEHAGLVFPYRQDPHPHPHPWLSPLNPPHTGCPFFLPLAGCIMGVDRGLLQVEIADLQSELDRAKHMKRSNEEAYLSQIIMVGVGGSCPACPACPSAARNLACLCKAMPSVQPCQSPACFRLCLCLRRWRRRAVCCAPVQC